MEQHLIIKIPPRHMKSLAVTVFWPMWEWLTHPERRFLFSSYAQMLREPNRHWAGDPEGLLPISSVAYETPRPSRPLRPCRRPKPIALSTEP